MELTVALLLLDHPSIIPELNDCGLICVNIPSKHIYIDLFRALEVGGMFLPRIHAELLQFADMWNNHKLSTESNRTPLQLLVYNADSVAEPEDAAEDDEVEINHEDELLEEPKVPSVICDPRECPLTVDQLGEFRERIQPISSTVPLDETMGILYRQGLHVISDIFHRS